MIPVFRPFLDEADIAEVVETLQSGWLGRGPKTAALETDFASFVGAPHAIATSTCTGALMAAMAVLGVGEGDQVIIPSFTWPSILQVLLTLKAEPVFADIEPGTLTLDPEDVRKKITPRTRGIVPVHHGGHLADLEGLSSIAREAGLWLVDDAAHACGAIHSDGRRVGNHGLMTCFSFNAVKNLAAGDGGMVTTADSSLARQLKVFCSLGLNQDTYARYGPGSVNQSQRWAYDIESVGQRLHMNDISASIAAGQLRRLDTLNKRRGELVARYREAFSHVEEFQYAVPRPGTTPSWHMMTVLLDGRDDFIEAMKSHSIAVGVHYRPLHHLSVSRPWACSLPVTEEVASKTASLPLYPSMTEAEQQSVIEAALASRRRPSLYFTAAR